VAGPQSFVFHRRKNSPGPHLEAGELASIRCVYLVTVSYRVFVVVVLHIEYIIDLAKPNPLPTDEGDSYIPSSDSCCNFVSIYCCIH
jgi:hypothetical protein